jgi:TPR repeat protein
MLCAMRTDSKAYFGVVTSLLESCAANDLIGRSHFEFLIADALRNGTGTVRDDAKAFAAYKRSADAQNASWAQHVSRTATDTAAVAEPSANGNANAHADGKVDGDGDGDDGGDGSDAGSGCGVGWSTCDGTAALMVGACLDQGIGLGREQRNWFEAMKWYSIAALRFGHATGLFNCAVNYEKGWGVPTRDVDHAKRLYRMASALGNPDALRAIHRIGPYRTLRHTAQHCTTALFDDSPDCAD